MAQLRFELKSQLNISHNEKKIFFIHLHYIALVI